MTVHRRPTSTSYSPTQTLSLSEPKLRRSGEWSIPTTCSEQWRDTIEGVAALTISRDESNITRTLLSSDDRVSCTSCFYCVPLSLSSRPDETPGHVLRVNSHFPPRLLRPSPRLFMCYPSPCSQPSGHPRPPWSTERRRRLQGGVHRTCGSGDGTP